MKLYLTILALFLISFTGTYAASGVSPRATVGMDAVSTNLHQNISSVLPDAQFAQINSGSSHSPISSRNLLTLVAVLVVGLRLMGLNHARAMADHERSSYRGKAEMFRSLHEKQTSDQ